MLSSSCNGAHKDISDLVSQEDEENATNYPKNWQNDKHTSLEQRISKTHSGVARAKNVKTLKATSEDARQRGHSLSLIFVFLEKIVLNIGV